MMTNKMLSFDDENSSTAFISINKSLESSNCYNDVACSLLILFRIRMMFAPMLAIYNVPSFVWS